MNEAVYVWCVLIHGAVICPFFFVEKMINGDLLGLYAIPLLKHLQPNVSFHQDGVPPRWTRPERELFDCVSRSLIELGGVSYINVPFSSNPRQFRNGPRSFEQRSDDKADS
ncbi:hypothetical protein AVEN_222998-1 [Araneus ventricosus]|uniref:Uncharacterized protein n=1 Tax=Araneus ventricosus TaxID=182803 RepID=A0A4Y2GI18_ARAVE|nr:hypothetical protein AVEN_201577-1 [Araneus ventricosus]GBM52193.1 hypothetical protein AVEN_222998-1 [Araneus ventricosus]